MGKIIIKNDITRQKKVELLNVFEILGVSGIEFLNDLQKSCNHLITTQNIGYGGMGLPTPEIVKLNQNSWLTKIKDVTLIIDEKIVEFKRILNYCNEQFIIIGVNYNTTSYYIPIDQELESTLTKDFYHLSKKNWSLKKNRYSI